MGVFQRSSMMELVRDTVLVLLVSIFLVASETWLFKQDLFLKKLEVAIRLFIPVLLVIFFRKYTFPPKAKVLLFLYATLSFYMFFTSIFSESPALVALNNAKLLYILTFPIALLLILHPNNFSYRLLYIPVYLGLFFSIQTIILFVLIQSNHPPPGHIVTLVGYKNMEVLSYGLWGYAHGMLASGTVNQVYRAQSWFGEPTELASFMATATILSFGLYRVKKEKKMLVVCFLCTVSLIISFSITAFVAVFLTFCLYKIVLSWKRLGILGPVVVVMTVPVIIIVVLVYFYMATHPDFYGHSKWGVSFGHSPTEIRIRVAALINSLLIFMDYPFGLGLIGHTDSKILLDYPVTGARLAPLGWMISTGIVGITVQLTILSYLFVKIIIKQIRECESIKRYIALSFVALTLHQCVAGAWFSSLFFYLLACIVVTDAYQFSFYSNHKKGLAKMDDSNVRSKRF